MGYRGPDMPGLTDEEREAKLKGDPPSVARMLFDKGYRLGSMAQATDENDSIARKMLNVTFYGHNKDPALIVLHIESEGRPGLNQVIYLKNWRVYEK